MSHKKPVITAAGYVPLSAARIRRFTNLANEAGARIHILRRIRVKQNREWQKAIAAASLNTPSHYNVWKPEVGAQYRPVSKIEMEMDIVLWNYPKDGENCDKAINWGRQAKLNAANPREVFAIGEKKPDLHIILNQKSMYVVAPIECVFKGQRSACCVWLNHSKREAGLGQVSDFGNADDWFAFHV